MTKEDFVKWLKTYLTDVTLSAGDEARIRYMLDKVYPERTLTPIVKTETKVVKRVVKELVDKIVYVDRLTGAIVNRRCVRDDNSIKQPLDLLAKEFCEQYGIEVSELVSKCRERNLVRLRKYFCDYAWSVYPYSSKELGKFLNRDHSTIIYLKNNFKEFGYGTQVMTA